MSNWEDLGDDALWRRVGAGRYHFIGIDEVDDGFFVSLSEVDVWMAGPKLLEEAVDAAGIDELPGEDKWKAQLLVDCGYKAPFGSWSCDTEEEIDGKIAEAKKESNRLRVHEYHEEKMQEPANRIGSTVREFMLGNLNRALTNTMASGSTEGNIMAKMYGLSEDDRAALPRTPPTGPVTARISLGLMTRQGVTDDPLAMASGYMSALAGQGLWLDRKGLAPAYIKGFQVGTDVRAGRSPQPDWAR